ncbi:MAG: EthD domain-containing protein [Candidatus Binataceae bacterium]|jgi:uncharacterized protein (TIGR02118 family)
MLHALYFITRKPGLSDAEFHRYWREVHGPIAKAIPQLKGYVQTHRIPFPGGFPNSPYDGAAEVMFESEGSLEQMRREPIYLKGALADEPNFIDMSRVGWQVTNDHVIIDGAAKPGMAKAVFQVRRKPGLTLSAFRKYWLEVHGPIVSKFPGLKRYVQCHAIDASYTFGSPLWDGVAELWCDDVDAMVAMLDSKEFREVGWPDAYNFLDTVWMFVAQEHRVI